MQVGRVGDLTADLLISRLPTLPPEDGTIRNTCHAKKDGQIHNFFVHFFPIACSAPRSCMVGVWRRNGAGGRGTELSAALPPKTGGGH